MSSSRTRRAGREHAVQFLFGLDFSGYAPEDVLEDFWAISPVRRSVRAYADQLILGAWGKLGEVDQTIENALEAWSPARVGYIERAILRVATFEMLHEPDVPVNVAINEAIEVAKVFGAEEAPRFVNGVLDRIRRDLNAGGDTGPRERAQG